MFETSRAARGAFTHAFALAALVSAGIAVGAAVLAGIVLGRRRPGAEASAAE